MLIGVLALQGAFIEHERMLARLGVASREVRQRKHLAGIDGLIIPGGESTTMGKLLDVLGMTDEVRALGRAGLPIWGTCAGLIVLATDVGREQTTLGLLDITVRRNAFGSQLDSFETDLDVPALGAEPFH
ncbi:MAG TPA: pyridoxal 5'-phosphate synthase glutaminase subunit PdxT, partial [Thermomicrobiales bacterium]|nr:pyridoxal 5'-phosphate synthase glutaminase subunit PdxT [Thermomicrobiales bacterium]